MGTVIAIVLFVAVVALLANIGDKKRNNRQINYKRQIEIYDTLKKKTDEIRAENEAWSRESSPIFERRAKAKELEKQKDISDALELYLRNISEGESSVRLNVNNYAHDIHRVIIIYGKLKEFEKLRDFLHDKINRYPDLKDIEDWKTRLEKVNLKLNRK